MSNGQSIVKVFATTGSGELGAQVETEIRKRISTRREEYVVKHGGHSVSLFSNENIEVQIDNVRDLIALVIHTQNPPVNDGVIELFASRMAAGSFA